MSIKLMSSTTGLARDSLVETSVLVMVLLGHLVAIADSVTTFPERRVLECKESETEKSTSML